MGTGLPAKGKKPSEVPSLARILVTPEGGMMLVGPVAGAQLGYGVTGAVYDPNVLSVNRHVAGEFSHGERAQHGPVRP
jgi:hypothetical protein